MRATLGGYFTKYFASLLSPHSDVGRSCNASLETSLLSGPEDCEEEEEHQEHQDYEIPSSPLSTKRLKVSDINITRYIKS